MAKHTVIVVGGPAGTGKSTIAELLAEHFGCPYVEGDDLHPAENVKKMSLGHPLTDDDRWGWLTKVSTVATKKCFEPSNESKVSIVSCSMLKKVYRDHLKSNCGTDKPVQFRFVFLYTTLEELIKRVSGRQGHYMKSNMVKDQIGIMEIPDSDSENFPVDTTNKTPSQICAEVLLDLNI